ncbi:MAG: hypothetical protein ACD_10C00454G0001 [uncultured bacterium]|nr:MAG: hypothetical protein ACD_10C00454G0001 [uncultured bacterium]
MSGIYNTTGDRGLDSVFTLAEMYRDGELVLTEKANPVIREFAESLFKFAIERLPEYQHARQETDQ